MDTATLLQDGQMAATIAIGAYCAYRHIKLPPSKFDAVESALAGVASAVVGLQATADQHTAQITAMTAPAVPATK